MALKVGIQMFSVRNEMEKDPVEAIRQVANLGYQYIELANLNAKKDFGCGFGAEPDDLRKAIEPFGATIISAHIDPFDKDNVDKVLDYHSRLGTKCLMSKSINANPDAVLRHAELLNYIGKKCRARGIDHCLHTCIIGKLPDGRDILDLYVENTDPSTLFFEFDAYWCLRSGLDPIDMIKKHGRRIKLIHEKDLPKNFEKEIDLTKIADVGDGWLDYYFSTLGSEDFTEIGDGCMDIQGIINATLQYTDAEYLLLEQDFSSLGELASIKRSMQNMKRMQGLLL